MSTVTVSPLRQRMIEDMNARKLCAETQRGHIHSCRRFAAFLKQSPDTATAEDIRRFQLHLSETGVSICNRNRIMTGLRFLLRVTLRRLDLAAEIYHIREASAVASTWRTGWCQSCVMLDNARVGTRSPPGPSRARRTR